jgi:hypothetical protein
MKVSLPSLLSPRAPPQRHQRTRFEGKFPGKLYACRSQCLSVCLSFLGLPILSSLNASLCCPVQSDCTHVRTQAHPRARMMGQAEGWGVLGGSPQTFHTDQFTQGWG